MVKQPRLRRIIFIYLFYSLKMKIARIGARSRFLRYLDYLLYVNGTYLRFGRSIYRRARPDQRRSRPSLCHHQPVWRTNMEVLATNALQDTEKVATNALLDTQKVAKNALHNRSQWQTKTQHLAEVLQNLGIIVPFHHSVQAINDGQQISYLK